MADERDIRSIWVTPKLGAVPDVTSFVQAEDLEALDALSATFWQRYAEVLEAENAQVLKDLDVGYRPTLIERVQDTIIEWFDGIRGRNIQPQADAGALPFMFDMPLGSTRPTWELSFEYDEMFGETARFRDGIAAQISAARGAPFRFEYDVDRMDEMIEDDDDQSEFAHRLEGITQYWPPQDGRPALALSEMQEDGGLPIEVALIAHPPAAHDVMVQRLKDELGGRLIPHEPSV